MRGLYALLVALLFTSPVAAGTFKYPGGSGSATFTKCFHHSEPTEPTVGDWMSAGEFSSRLTHANVTNVTNVAHERAIGDFPEPPNGGAWSLVRVNWKSRLDAATSLFTGIETLTWKIRYRVAGSPPTYPVITTAAADIIMDVAMDDYVKYDINVGGSPIPANALGFGVSANAQSGSQGAIRFEVCATFVEQ